MGARKRGYVARAVSRSEMLGGRALLQGGDEGGPGGWAEGERRAGRVLGVADRDHMTELGYFDAVGLGAAVAGLAPLGTGQVHRVHSRSYSAATDATNSADRRGSSAVSRSVSTAETNGATISGSSRKSPDRLCSRSSRTSPVCAPCWYGMTW